MKIALMGMLLRYSYEVSDASEYFDVIQDVKITKDTLDLARHIVDQKFGHFEPGKFEDHYEPVLSKLLAQKQKGVPITAAKKAAPDNVVNLMDACALVSDREQSQQRLPESGRKRLLRKRQGRKRSRARMAFVIASTPAPPCAVENTKRAQ